MSYFWVRVKLPEASTHVSVDVPVVKVSFAAVMPWPRLISLPAAPALNVANRASLATVSVYVTSSTVPVPLKVLPPMEMLAEAALLVMVRTSFSLAWVAVPVGSLVDNSPVVAR
ncbi:Uncharacterised protein [Achromobacter xylosoxidans]|nr:Uncharacterised protein [Achromobacter xylosoxidans]